MKRLVATCVVVAAIGAAAAFASGEGAAVSLARSVCAPPQQLGPGVSEWLNDTRTMPPTTGELRMAMIFIDFPDAPGIGEPRTIHGLFAPGLVDYYRTVSNGRLRLEVVPFAQWIRLPKPSTAYVGVHREGYDVAVKDAIAVADPLFDFGAFHGVYVVPARDARLPIHGVTLYGHEPLRPDGAELRTAAWIFTDGIGAAEAPYITTYAIHETIHVLGIPDQSLPPALSTLNHWDVAATGGTIGVAGGLHAWHRWKLGWLDDAQVACLRGRGRRVATVTPLARPGGVKALVVRSGYVAYVAEVRRRLAEDSRLCRPGVLLYAVDLRSPAQGGPVRGAVRIIPARTDDTNRWKRCGGHWNGTFGIGRGEKSRMTVGKVKLEVLAALKDGSYRLRVTHR